METKPQDNAAILRRFYEAFNGRNLDALDELLSEDFEDHTPDPNQPPGPNGVKQSWQLLWGTFRTIRIEVEDILAGEDNVASYLRLATDVPGQGEGRMIDFVRIGDGRITDMWSVIAVGRRPGEE